MRWNREKKARTLRRSLFLSLSRLHLLVLVNDEAPILWQIALWLRLRLCLSAPVVLTRGTFLSSAVRGSVSLVAFPSLGPTPDSMKVIYAAPLQPQVWRRKSCFWSDAVFHDTRQILLLHFFTWLPIADPLRGSVSESFMLHLYLLRGSVHLKYNRHLLGHLPWDTSVSEREFWQKSKSL